jgi:phage shock protein PspC (stress-responsive transcriptional regulator)
MTLRQLASEVYRPAETRLMAGVCSGLAQALVVDVTLLRLAFLLLTMASGLGLLIYLLLWLFIPSEGRLSREGERIVWTNMRGVQRELHQAVLRLRGMWSERGRTPWPVPLDRRWFAVALITAGMMVVLLSLGAFSWLGTTRALGLAAIVVGASVLITTRT